MRAIPKFILIIILALIHGCKPETVSHRKNSDETAVLPKASEAFIKKFNEFFKLFNTDSAFQKERIKFPFRVNLINPREENHTKDKHIYVEKNDFVILDLQKFESDLNYKTYRGVSSDGQATFTVNEIGTENSKTYYFKIVNKKWLMISCNDFSLSH